MKRRAAEWLAGMGLRRQAMRAGRWVTNVARLDLPNEMGTNGEGLVVAGVAAEWAAGGGKRVAFDIGANRGEWTAALLEQCGRRGAGEVTVHAFEPVAGTMGLLEERLRGEIAAGRVVAVAAGMGMEKGEAEMRIVGPGAGTNSVVANPLGAALPVEWVRMWTVDDYCEEQGIERVDFVKIDVEGYDLAVLRGAMGMLRAGRIGYLQFEYNHRWVWSRSFLLDVFGLARETGYELGKVTALGVETYGEWHPELEKYVEGNYLLSSGAPPVGRVERLFG
jgi:FkbM family methyltransferase